MELGAVLYEGPSQFVPTATIVAILTIHSNNKKTGGIPQVWMVDKSIAPQAAIKTGDDVAICGDCRLRSNGCYVVTYQAPRSVRAAYARGSYMQADANSEPSALDSWLKKANNRYSWPAVRIGAYGDPYSVPIDVWHNLSASIGGIKIIGYTQQWLKPDAQDYKSYCMASVFSPEEGREAVSMGWRYFRVRKSAEEPLEPNEFVCPASNERGHQLSCARCKSCNGSLTGPRRANPVIAAHGSRSKQKRLARIIE